MNPIVLVAEVDEKRRIMIDLPDDVPVGRVELVIRPLESSADAPSDKLTREQIRAKLIAAGHVSNLRKHPEAKELSPEERDRIGKKLAEGGALSQQIIDDREDRI